MVADAATVDGNGCVMAKLLPTGGCISLNTSEESAQAYLGGAVPRNLSES